MHADEATLLWRAQHFPLLGERYTRWVIVSPLCLSSRARPDLQFVEVRTMVRTSGVLNIERICPNQTQHWSYLGKNKLGY